MLGGRTDDSPATHAVEGVEAAVLVALVVIGPVLLPAGMWRVPAG